jgi:hypothetical protein
MDGQRGGVYNAIMNPTPMAYVAPPLVRPNYLQIALPLAVVAGMALFGSGLIQILGILGIAFLGFVYVSVSGIS